MMVGDPNDVASKKEVALLLKEVIDAVKKINSELKEDVKKVASEVKGEVVSSNETNSSTVKELKAEVKESIKDLSKLLKESVKEAQNKAYKDLNAEVYKLEKLISEVPQFSPAQLEAKFGAVITDLENRLSTLKPTAIEVRDLLETLQDDDRLDITAVKGAVGVHVGPTPPDDTSMLWVDVR